MISKLKQEVNILLVFRRLGRWSGKMGDLVAESSGGRSRNSWGWKKCEQSVERSHAAGCCFAQLFTLCSTGLQ